MSKEKLLLVGAGGFGRMVAEQAMLQYDCAFVDDGQAVGTEICGIPVVGGLANLPELRREYGLLVVGIGNNQLRAQVYEKAKALGFAFPNIVAPSAYVSPFAKIGCGCVVLGGCWRGHWPAGHVAQRCRARASCSPSCSWGLRW